MEDDEDDEDLCSISLCVFLSLSDCSYSRLFCCYVTFMYLLSFFVV